MACHNSYRKNKPSAASFQSGGCVRHYGYAIQCHCHRALQTHSPAKVQTNNPGTKYPLWKEKTNGWALIYYLRSRHLLILNCIWGKNLGRSLTSPRNSLRPEGVIRRFSSGNLSKRVPWIQLGSLRTSSALRTKNLIVGGISILSINRVSCRKPAKSRAFPARV